MLNAYRHEGSAMTLTEVCGEFKSAVKTIYIFIKAGVIAKPLLFHSINLPQQEGREGEKKWQDCDAVRFLYKWWLIQEFSCSIRCPVQLEKLMHASFWMGGSGGGQGVFSGCWTLRCSSSPLWLSFNCSYYSWCWACTCNTMTTWQIFREGVKMKAWPGNIWQVSFSDSQTTSLMLLLQFRRNKVSDIIYYLQ